jgi:uncharacterized repeat protein (TIGR03803 family)
VFAITPDGKERIVYRFKPPAGINPGSALIHVGDKLYGVTSGGGTGHCGAGPLAGCGTVFELSISGRERTIYSFKGSLKNDGEQPGSGLLYVRGKFYGTTWGGGKDVYLGTVFEVDMSGRERILHTFTGGKDGQWPSASLIDVNGTFYGTTSQGGGAKWCHPNIGAEGCGTIFSITRSGAQRVIYRFKGDRDGAQPVDALVELHGQLYGTTYFGGITTYCPGGCGTVFEVDPSSGSEHIIYRFPGSASGFQPTSSLLAHHDKLYGTTLLGGTNGISGPCSISGLGGCGTIYEVSTSGKERVLHDFQGPPDGDRPAGPRLLEVNGTLYGTTPQGGPHCRPELGCGTVFAITP